MPPDLIAGRYRVLREVGRGGMGAVWLCHDQVLQREVALKQIEHLDEQSAARAALPLREARVAAALNHENAVSMFDIVEDHGSTWLVMEYVPSRTLAQILHDEGRLPVDRVARIGTQLASALATAHALGIVHRDIKPGNVLIGENDVAKISDFGIARGHQDEQLTLTGFVTGTPSYFSPELARGGEPSQASDVWALGATLYAAVEGEPPYGKDSNPLALLTRIASEPPPRPAHAGPLTRTLASMLNPQAEARASMEAVVTSLQQLAEPADVKAARVREKRRVYTDTTLHDRPMFRGPAAAATADSSGMLDEMLGGTPDEPAQVTARATDDLPTVVTPAAGRAATRVGPPPPTQPDRPPHRGRPSLQLVIVGVAAVLVLLVAGAVVWSLASSPTGNDTARTSGTAGQRGEQQATGGNVPTTTRSTTTSGPGGQQTSQASTSPPPPNETTPNETTPNETTPSEPQDTDSGNDPPPSGESPAAFVTSYFQLVPDDLKSGYKQLAPSMRQQGRDSYEHFWGSIEFVEVTDVRADGTEAVNYQITYHFVDGRVVQEDKRIGLERHGQSYWITSDTSLRSTTLSQ